MYTELPKKRFNNSEYIACRKYSTKEELDKYLEYLTFYYKGKDYLRNVKINNAMYYYIDNYGDEELYECLYRMIGTPHPSTFQNNEKLRLNYSEEKTSRKKRRKQRHGNHSNTYSNRSS